MKQITLLVFLSIAGVGCGDEDLPQSRFAVNPANAPQGSQVTPVNPPDLVPEPKCVRAQQGGLTVTIKNNGAFANTTAATARVDYSFSTTPQFATTELIPGNESRDVLVSWPPEPVPAGDFDITITADPGGLVPESNEANNTVAVHCIS